MQCHTPSLAACCWAGIAIKNATRNVVFAKHLAQGHASYTTTNDEYSRFGRHDVCTMVFFFGFPF